MKRHQPYRLKVGSKTADHPYPGDGDFHTGVLDANQKLRLFGPHADNAATADQRIEDPRHRENLRMQSLDSTPGTLDGAEKGTAKG